MSYIFLSQGKGVEVISKLAVELRGRLPTEFDDMVIFVSSKRFFSNQTEAQEAVKSFDLVIREWEYFDRKASQAPNVKDLQRFEEVAGSGSIWESIVSDRRMIYGRYCKVTYDPNPRFRFEEYLTFTSRFARVIMELFDKKNVKGVISLVPVTCQETMTIKYAQGLGVPCFSLHSTRIDNFFTFYPNYTGSPDHVKELLSDDAHVLSDSSRSYGREFVEKAKKGNLVYEGVNLTNTSGPKVELRAIYRIIASFFEIRSLKRMREVLSDLHDISQLEVVWFRDVIRPLRYQIIKQIFRKHQKDINGFIDAKMHSFFPMHAEPEVSLQVLGRPYFVDQLYLLRTIALSLPAGEFLLVKEHPRALGMRPVDYYKKIISIPNVKLVFQSNTDYILSKTKTVFTIAGTVGLEALLQGVPVITFGKPKYSGLELLKTFAYCGDLLELPRQISDVRKAKPDEQKLIHYIGAVHERCIRLNLYSQLLQKKGRYSGVVSRDVDVYDMLAAHLLRVMQWERTGIWTV